MNKKFGKRGIVIGLVALLLVSTTGCSGNNDWMNGNNILDAKMDKSVEHVSDLSDVKTLELNIDLSVSGVEIESTSSDELTFSQKASHDKLLAKMDENKKGDKMILTFKNDQSIDLGSVNQNAMATISVPDSVEIILISNLDVGGLTVNMDDLTFLEVDASSDVGEVVLNSKKAQNKLEFIQMETNVGEIVANLNGEQKQLQDIITSTDTGEITIDLAGDFGKALNIAVETNVGDGTVNLGGIYKKAVKVIASSDVGELNIGIPKNNAVEMTVDAPEFTSELDTNGIDFSQSKNKWILDGDKPVITLDLTANVGDISVDFAK